MAEETKTLLLSLQFDTDEGLKRAADFRSAIDADKEALSELNKVIKKNGEMSQAQLVERERLEQSIRANVKSRNDELRAIDGYIKASKAQRDENGKSNTSIKELRASQAYLTEQWNGLTRAERENVQIGGVLRKELKSISDELKENGAAVGDNRMNVGGYLDAIRQAPGAMGKMKAGINGISSAISVSPLGLLTTALQVIPQLMNSSGEGADFFAKALSIMNAIVQEGLKRLVALGGAAVKLMSGDFKGAFNDGKAAMSGFSESVNNAVKAGGALADRLDALEVAESKFTVTQAKAKKQIDELLIQARNRQTSEAERIKLLEKAEKLEVQLNQQGLKLAKERLALIQEENKIKQSDEDEEQARVNEQLARITEFEAESSRIQEKIQVRKDALADAALEREKKRAEERAKLEKEYNEKREKALKETEDFQAKMEEFKKEKEAELEKERKEALQKEFESNEAVRQARIKSEQEITKRLADEANQRVAIKELEYKSLATLAQSASEIAGVLADENSAFAEFQKAITGFQIAMNLAQAISKLTASSTEVAASVASVSGPLGAITGPLAYASYYGTQIAAIFTGISQAKELISGAKVPKAPTSKLAEGGVLDGPSHAEGGIKGTGRFANVEVEGNEIILTKGVYLNPALRAVANQLNIMGGGKPLAPTNYAAMGGYLSGNIYSAATNQASNAPAIDYNKLAKAVSNQPIYVIPTEIKAKANAADARKAQAGLGKKAA